MRITFLGCKGSLQTECDLNTSLLFEDDKGAILVDCSGSLHKCVKSNISDVILTHEHIDHMYGLPSLLHQMWLSGRSDKLVIHGSGEALKLAERLVDTFKLKTKKGMFEISFEEMKPFVSDGVSVDFFSTSHTLCSFGLIFTSYGRKIVYTSDTQPIKFPSKAMMHPDLLITEASGIESDKPALVDKGHQSGLDAALLAKSLGAVCMKLVHLPESQAKCFMIESEARREFPSASIASPMEVYEVL